MAPGHFLPQLQDQNPSNKKRGIRFVFMYIKESKRNIQKHKNIFNHHVHQHNDTTQCVKEAAEEELMRHRSRSYFLAYSQILEHHMVKG